jgi:hypothetical protein
MADTTTTTTTDTTAKAPPIPAATPPVLQAAATAAAGSESKIKAMIAALSAEIEKVEGEGSEFLTRAKSHVANVWMHLESHFTRARTIAATAAAKIETDAAAAAAAVQAKV